MHGVKGEKKPRARAPPGEGRQSARAPVADDEACDPNPNPKPTLTLILSLALALSLFLTHTLCFVRRPL